MFSLKSSKTTRNGLSLNNKLGIFDVDGSPIGKDAGVPMGSIALDYVTPAIWHKFGNSTTDWTNLSAVTGADAHQLQHTNEWASHQLQHASETSTHQSQHVNEFTEHQLQHVNEFTEHQSQHVSEFSALSDLISFGEQIQFSLIQDIRPSDIDGGTSREEKWNVRAINNIAFDKFSNVAIVGDDFTLKPGTYSVRITCVSHDVGKNKIRVLNEMTNNVEFEGLSVESKEIGLTEAVGIITSNGTDLFEIQHYTEEKQERTGLGKALKIGTDEIYTTVEIMRVGK